MESLGSFETIIEFASQFYLNDMDPYFDVVYLQVLADMIEKIMHPNKPITYITSTETLNEPIVSHYPEYIIFSLPLIALIINAPLVERKEEIKIEKNFNIMNVLKPLETQSTFDEEKKLMNPDRRIVFLILIRMTIMIQHWRQHVITNTEATLSHKDFKPIEMARELQSVIDGDDTNQTYVKKNVGLCESDEIEMISYLKKVNNLKTKNNFDYNNDDYDDNDNDDNDDNNDDDDDDNDEYEDESDEKNNTTI